MIEIYLIRHGEAIGQGCYLGRRSDPVLSEKGRAQVLSLKSVLPAPSGASRFYSSPLKRAVETADILFNISENQTGLCVIEEFCEIDFGEWDGLSWQDISALDDQGYRAWLENPAGISPPGGENLNDFCTRVETGFRSVTDDCLHNGIESLFITAHGGVIRSILGFILGLTADKHWLFRIDTASVSCIRLFSEAGVIGPCRIESLNLTAF